LQDVAMREGSHRFGKQTKNTFYKTVLTKYKVIFTPMYAT